MGRRLVARIFGSGSPGFARRHPVVAPTVARRRMTDDRVPSDRLWFIGRKIGRLESADFRAIEFDAQHPLDAAKRKSILGHHQTESFTGLAHSGSPADTMDVGIGGLGQVEIDDVGDVGDVESAGGYVGGDQHRVIALAKSGERRVALALGASAVNRDRFEAVADQQFRDAIRPDLGAREDDRGIDFVAAEQMQQHRRLVFLGHRIDGLTDGGRRGRGITDPHAGGIDQKLARDLLDFGTHRGRKHQRLAGFPDHPQDSAQLWKEAHIEHPVGLVDDHHFDSIEIDRAAFQVIDEASGTCHQDLNAGAHFTYLLAHRFAAHDDSRTQASVAGKQMELVAGLRGKFAGRREHQRPDPASPMAVKTIEDRE